MQLSSLKLIIMSKHRAGFERVLFNILKNKIKFFQDRKQSPPENRKKL